MGPRKPPPPPAEGLLDLLAPADQGSVRVATPEGVYGAAEAGVKWLGMPKGRHLCTLCVRAIHGKKDGPSPQQATARRRGPNEELLLCPTHAIDMRELDDAAEAARKARIKATGERPTIPRQRGRQREHA